MDIGEAIERSEESGVIVGVDFASAFAFAIFADRKVLNFGRRLEFFSMILESPSKVFKEGGKMILL